MMHTTTVVLPEATDWPHILRNLAWSPAPRKVEWGDGMLVADVALTTDETLTLYMHKGALS